MIKVLIADDHTIVRKGIRQLLEDSSKIRVTGEAGNYNEIMSALKNNNFDIVLLDISMPGRSGLEALKSIKEYYPNLPVLILSMYPEDQYAVRLVRSGASGYLTKESAPDQLINAIITISSGKKYINPQLGEQLALYLHQDLKEPLHHTLSDREFEVMCKLAAGKSLTLIADDLNLSVKTISTYKSRIFRKMGFKNATELAIYVIKSKIPV